MSKLFLQNGNRVFGIEPNPEMRSAGERLLAEYEGFTSMAGSAEQSQLPDSSVDLVAAGQAFHWFDRQRARAEFQRILKPGGWVVILWNNRLTDTTPFLRAYENLLLSCGTDYAQIDITAMAKSCLSTRRKSIMEDWQPSSDPGLQDVEVFTAFPAKQ